MDNRKLTDRIASGVLIAALLAMVSGCSATGKAADWLTGKRAPETSEAVVLGAPESDEYLKELQTLVSGDANAQADIFADASSAARLTPGPSTKLRLALVLASPGHAQFDPVGAQSLLGEILAETQLLTNAEIALAEIALNSVERLIATDSEARRLSDASSRAARTEEQALSQRLASVEAENRRLQRELEEAEQKLEAITSIERSIREQE